MHRKRKQRKIVIVSLLFILLVMSGAYAAFRSNVKVRGTTRITSNWDIRITNVTSGTPTGSATNEVAPTWNALTANMSANLYEKGDAMEYDVTITNNGTVDAILSDVIGTPSNNNAVIISFTGYTKGEKLYKKGHEGNTKVVHVKIEYNPEYDGGPATGEASVEFNYTQGEGGDIPVNPNVHLVTYNYSYNGGASSETHDEYINDGTIVTLNKSALKPGWTFVGWNTNRNAQTGLNTIEVSNDVTLYAIFSKTLTVTYQKSENVESISKTEDSCVIYNLEEGCTKTLPTITPKAGYTADTWYNGNTEVGKSGQQYQLRSNLTLTTKEVTNKYQVLYNYSENGGSSSTKTEASVEYNKNIDLTPVATKQGWTFVGWNTNKDATSGLESLKMGTSDVTLYAIYKKEAITLTAKFNANGATLSSTSNKTCTLAAVYNKAVQDTSCSVDAPTITAPSNTPTIVGFNTSASSTTNNTSYNSSTGKITLTASSNNATWYAITKKDAVVRKITFNPNGNVSYTYNGTRQTSTKTYDLCTIAASFNGAAQGSSCEATITLPTIEAHSNTPTLIGWSNSSTNRTPAYTSGQANTNIIATSDLTYFAQTTKAKRTLTVTYEKGVGVSSLGKNSDSCDLAVTYNGVAQATQCGITLTTMTVSSGYTKDGFYSGNTKVGNENDSYNLSDNITLIAKATAKSYTIGYTMNGGSNPSTKPTSGTYNADVQISNPSSKTVTITGNANGLTGLTIGDATTATQTFKGWTSTTTNGSPLTGSTSSNLAAWTASTATKNTYFKNLRNDTGTVTMVANWNTAATTLPTVTKDGYTCAWYSAEGTSGGSKVGDSGAAYTPGATSGQSVTVYARCTYNATPSITRNDYNTFTASAASGSQYFISKTQSSAPTASASGWSATASQDVSTTEKETWYVWVKDASGNVSANSKTITNYKVTLTAGTGTTLTAKADNNSTGANVTNNSYVLNGTPVFPTGALNAGYSTLVVKKGTTTITNSSSQTISADTTFTTSATANTYTIGYTMNGGSNPSTKPTSGTYNADVQISNPSSKTVTITGNANGLTGLTIGDATTATQTFKGWTSTTIGENAKTGTSANPSTAWDGSNTKNTYFKNLKESGTVTMVAGWNTAATTLPTVTKEGYTCAWYDTQGTSGGSKVGDSGASYTPGATSAQAVTVYARCTAKSYTIGYTMNGGSDPSTKPTSGTYDSDVQISNPASKTVTLTGDANGLTGLTIGNATTATQTFKGWTSTTIGENAKTGTSANPSTAWDGSNTKNTYFKNLKESGTVTMVAGWNTAATTLPTVTKEGYTCAWYDTQGTSGGSKVGDSGASYTPGATSAQAVTLYARCTAKSYTIGYTMNGGSNPSTKPTSGTYNADVQISNPSSKTVTITGNANGLTGLTIGDATTATQTFKGWTSTTTNGSPLTGSTSSNLAAWTASTATKNTYFKNLRNDTGTVTMVANWNTAATTLPTVTKDGYTCAWYSAEGTSGGSKVGDSGASYTPGATSAQAVTVYARCTYNATPSITRNDYNTFTASATAGSQYFISKTQTTAPTASASGWSTTASKDVSTSEKETWYVWVKDANGNVSPNSKTITNFKVTLTAGTGTTLTAKADNNTNGANVTNNSYVLSGTAVFPTGALSAGYNTLVVKKGTTTITNSSSQTISADTTFTTSATANTYTIGYTMNGGSNPSTKPTSGTYNADVQISNPSSKTVTITGNANGLTGLTIGDATTATQTFKGWTSTTIGENAKTGTSANPSTAWDGSNTKNTYFKNLKESGTVTMVAGWNTAATTLPTVTKEGYTCAWYDTQGTSGGSKVGDSGASYTPGATSAQAVTVYARCTYNATPSITRNDYNTFTASATAGSQYFISKTQTTAPTASASGWSTTASKDVSTSEKETWYVWVKDANGNVSPNSKTITNFKVTLTAGTGTTLTAKADNNTNGANVTNNSYVLSGTAVFPTGALSAGYNTLVVKKGTTTITNSSSQTISADTTFTTSATANTYTIGYTMNGGSNPSTKPTSGTYNADVQISNPSSKTVTITGNANGLTGLTIGDATTATQTFKGWTSTTTNGSPLTGSTSSNLAAWTASTATKNTYFKNLRNDTGTVTMVANWNTAATTLPTVTKDGYTCSWYDTQGTTGGSKIGDSGASYTPGATSAQAVTLYARCTANSYTISYTMNGGPDPATKPTSGTYGSDVQISNPGSKTVTLTGDANGLTGLTIGEAATATQTFKGWTSTTIGSNAKSGTSANPTTAWDGSNTKNTYFKNLKESGTVTMVANWNTAATTLPTVTKEGYTCAWYSTSGTSGGSKVGDSGASYTPGATSGASVTVYARCTYNATPSITRNDYNTFTASATAGSQYFISKTQSSAPTASASGWSATASQDVSTTEKETWYVWVKDASGNVSANSKTITNYKVTLTAGTGTTLTAKADNNSTGANVTNNSYVLNGTPVFPTGALNAGYSTLVVKKGSSTITNGSSQTISADTTFTTSATANTYTIGYTMNGGSNPSTKPTSGTYGSDVQISNPGSKTVTITGNANGLTGLTIGSNTTATQTFKGWTSTTIGSNAKSGTSANPTTAWDGSNTKNTYFKNLKESGTVTMVANWNTAATTLPTVTKEGYTCAWYSAEGTSGGSKVGDSGGSYTPGATSGASVTVYARCTDAEKPTSTISGGTSLKQTSQSVSIKCSDNIGVTAYYFGTTEPTSASAISTTTDLASVTGAGLSKTGLTNGTYYLGCKDAAGNFKTTSVVIRKYQVQNVLEKIAGTTGTYTSTNYETTGTAATYYVKDGTSLTLSSIYNIPTEAASGTFKGYTTVAPGSSAASPSTTAPTVAANDTTVYYMWFNRNTYTVTVTKPANGRVKAETVTKTGNSVTVTSSSSGDGSLTVKYGDTVKATATATINCTFESWSGGYVSGETNPVTGSIVTENKTITGTFKALPIIKFWSRSANVDFHNSTYKTNITSVIFEDNINVPSGATSWDVSAVTNSGAVIAWVTEDPTDSTKYVLHIGGEGGVIAHTDSSYIFYNFTNLKSINFNNNYDTSNVKYMNNMFSDCSKLTTLDLGDKFDTSNVSNMSYMFDDCQALTSLDLGDKFDTSSVTNMQDMFGDCSSLTSLDLGDKFDTSSVTNMQSMFANCYALTSLDLGDKFDTSSVQNMKIMFSNCFALTSLDLGDKFDTSKVTDMSTMFSYCQSLTSLDLGDKFDTSIVTNMSSMFQNCEDLTTIYAPTTFVTDSVTSSNYMFSNTTNLVGGNGTAVSVKRVYNKTYAKIDLPGQEGYFTQGFSGPTFTEEDGANNSIDVTITFPSECGSRLTCSYSRNGGTSVNVTSSSVTVNFTVNGTITAQVTDGNAVKSGSYTVTELSDPIIKSWGSSATTDFHNSTYRTNITSVIFEDNINVPSGATSWDVSAVTNSGAVIAWVTEDPTDSTKYVLHIGGEGGVIAHTDSSYIFYNFTNLKSINFNNNYDISSVTSMNSMFYGCSSLTSLDLGDKFDTSNVTSMGYMFYNCSGLTSLDLGDKFDTSKVTSMNSMFYGCSRLTSLDLGDKFDTSNVTSMSYMFRDCSWLTSLDLGDKFDTSNVEGMGYMFYGCSKLTSLDLGDKFDTSKVTSMIYMFYGCSSLPSLDLGDKFDTSIVTGMNYMFYNCRALPSLDLGDKFDTSSVKNMSNMFRNCVALTTIYAPTTFVTDGVTSSSSMFSNTTKLVGGNGTKVSVKKVYDKTYAKIDLPSQEGYFTQTFSSPTFTQNDISSNNVNVVITFPSGCGSTLTCKYKKDNGSYVDVTTSQETVNFTADGSLATTVSNGDVTRASSFTVVMP